MKNLDEMMNPIRLFNEWLEEAAASEWIAMPNAMTLGTVDETGMPAVRVVLLKDCDERGFTFYTNLDSAKGRHLQQYPKAALCFYWPPLRRQVRVNGEAERVGEEEAEEYFASRPRLSQIGAWASKQSHPLESSCELERRVAYYTARFLAGAVPRPSCWSGFRVKPWQIEFWSKQPYRLHDRILYTLEETGWRAQRLYP